MIVGPYLERLIAAARAGEPCAEIALTAYLRTFGQLRPWRAIWLRRHVRRELGRRP